MSDSIKGGERSKGDSGRNGEQGGQQDGHTPKGHRETSKPTVVPSCSTSLTASRYERQTVLASLSWVERETALASL